jgi:hypothetical protein
VWFYASRGQDVEKSYTDLCQLLNISAYRHLSKARSVLEPSMEELKRIEYLSSWDLVKSGREGDFKLVLSAGPRLLALPHVAGDPMQKRILPAPPSWAAELIRRGVTEARARQLAMDLSEGQPVLDQIEYTDFIIQQDGQGRRKIANPAGMYIWAIENNIRVPDDFETSRKREMREQKQNAAHAEQARLIDLQTRYDDYCDQQVSKRLEKEFPAADLQRAIREERKNIQREQPTWFDRVPEAVRDEAALTRLKLKLRASVKVLSFEQWSKANAQASLL